MNRRLILVGVVIIAVLVFYLIGSRSIAEEAGRFADSATCAELLADFEAEPVSDSATTRKQVGDEYRARFAELGCEL